MQEVYRHGGSPFQCALGSNQVTVFSGVTRVTRAQANVLWAACSAPIDGLVPASVRKSQKDKLKTLGHEPGTLCKTDLQRECVNKGSLSSGGHKTVPGIHPSTGNLCKGTP